MKTRFQKIYINICMHFILSNNLLQVGYVLFFITRTLITQFRYQSHGYQSHARVHSLYTNRKWNDYCATIIILLRHTPTSSSSSSLTNEYLLASKFFVNCLYETRLTACPVRHLPYKIKYICIETDKTG